MSAARLFALLAAGSVVQISYLAAAGGGSGGGAVDGSVGNGGQGGAGGFKQGVFQFQRGSSLSINVGAGGNRANGNDTSITGALTISLTGGGAGGSPGNPGSAGGSGGGAGNDDDGSISKPGGAGIAGQGYHGGAGGDRLTHNGGGGGAGGPGQDNIGVGGPGVVSSISGTAVEYCAGGPPSASPTPGSGGYGGAGGDGGVPGPGGDGIFILSYPGPQRFTGGVVTTVGGNTIHTFGVGAAQTFH